MSPSSPLFYSPESADGLVEDSRTADVCGKPKLIGIAKLAAQGEHLRDGHNVEYFSIEARSILTRCTAARMPFTWTVNPYRGCEFACRYCYARYTHEFMELRDNVQFERKIFVKQNVTELLRKDLRQVRPGESIAIGTATDPYQPAEKRWEVTRAIFTELSRWEGLDIGLVTKSNLILRDVELLQAVAQRNQLYINVTITTLDTQLARLLEPRAPRPDLRLETVRKLTQAGIPAGVICAPVLPGITDSPKALDALVEATAASGGHYIFANALFLKSCSASIFMPMIEQHFPHLVDDYRKRFGSSAFLSKAYRQRLSDLMKSLRAKHGIVQRQNWDTRRGRPPVPARSVAEQQLSLFDHETQQLRRAS